MRRISAAVGPTATGPAAVRTAVLALAALALVGCADMQPGGPMGARGYGYPPPGAAMGLGAGGTPGFNASEFDWSTGQGPGSLAGTVAYRSVSGEHWTCSGQTIALIPATRYSAARMQVLYGSRGQAVAPAADVRERNAQTPGVDYGRYVRTAACDGHDAFSFAGLPAGPYFLIARARPHNRPAGPEVGVVIMRQVDVGPGFQRLSVPTG